MAGRDIEIRGDGTPVRSYLYAGDLAAWLWTILLSDPPSKRNPAIVNVGSDEAISIADLARCVAEELNPYAKIRIAHPPSHSGFTERYVPSSCPNAVTPCGFGPSAVETSHFVRSSSAIDR